MSMESFRMKQFAVSHRLSAMKVGVDAVMLGAWAEVPASGRLLDAGCGCGIISLMLAQRYPLARIFAIDLDPLAVIEARQNFAVSPWSDRLIAKRSNFLTLKGKHDAIISNPPFFETGISAITTRRELARQAMDFTPLTLLSHGRSLLNPGGSISLVCPVDWAERADSYACDSGLHLARRCDVRGTPDSPFVRSLLAFTLSEAPNPAYETLTIELSRGVYTPEYRELTRNFYLKF